MVKKTAVLLCSIFVFGGIAFADADVSKKKRSAQPKEDKEKAVSLKKVNEAYHKELEALIEKYNNSSEKESVRNEMITLVSNYTDKNISSKKEKVIKDKEKIEKLEKEITAIEADKEKHVNNEVDFYLTVEGQKKLNEIREKEEKQLAKKKETAEKKKNSDSKKKK